MSASAAGLYKEIDCGATDITDKAFQVSFADGVSYEQAKRHLFEHMFRSKNEGPSHDNLLVNRHTSKTELVALDD